MSLRSFAFSNSLSDCVRFEQFFIYFSIVFLLLTLISKYIEYNWLNIKLNQINMKTKSKKTEIKSHFGFGEHWNELPQYQGYVPLDCQSWQSLKDQFFAPERYGFENPLPVNIRKDNNIIVVNLCGFKIPEAPPVMFLGTDAAVRGRVALCKIVTTKEFVAIVY